MNIKIEKEVEIAVMMKTGGVVGHRVAMSFKVVFKIQVAMKSLMNRSQAQKLGGWSRGSGRALARPIHSGQIVRRVLGCPFANVVALDDGLLLEEAAGEFKVGIINGARGIFPSDQA